MKCPHCGAATPAGARFCMVCGAELARDNAQSGVGVETPLEGKPGRRIRWGWLAVFVGMFVILMVMLAAPHSSAPLATVLDTNGTPMPTPWPTETPQDTGTPAATETAAPDPAKQADLRIFIGKVLGIQQPCLDAADSANTSFAAAAKGGDSVQAYQDAQAAQDACDATKSAAASLTAPDSLSEYKLGDVHTDLFTWAIDMGNVLNDYKKLLQNNNDVAAAADAKTMLKEVNFLNTLGAGLMAEASLALQVPIASITPVVPQ